MDNSGSAAALRLRVGVLGSAILTEADPRWAMAHDLGARLGSLGAEVVTGGYDGLMGAVSSGAHETGGHVVGLPMSAWTHLSPNAWNAELRWAADYPARLAGLLDTDAVIALDGGLGTLSELAVVWAAAQTEPNAPLIIAIGPSWRRLLEAFASDLVVDQEDIALCHITDDAATAVEALLAAVGKPRRPTHAFG